MLDNCEILYAITYKGKIISVIYNMFDDDNFSEYALDSKCNFLRRMSIYKLNPINFKIGTNNSLRLNGNIEKIELPKLKIDYGTELYSGYITDLYLYCTTKYNQPDYIDTIVKFDKEQAISRGNELLSKAIAKRINQCTNLPLEEGDLYQCNFLCSIIDSIKKNINLNYYIVVGVTYTDNEKCKEWSKLTRLLSSPELCLSTNLTNIEYNRRVDEYNKILYEQQQLGDYDTIEKIANRSKKCMLFVARINLA